MHRIVTIKTSETFVGNTSGWVVVETGAGGGDCGYGFGLGERYLVYAYREKNGSLRTSICMRTQKESDASADLAYLRTIKNLPEIGRLYGTVKQYTFDPNFKPAEVSITSPYGGPEEQLMSMKPLTGTKLHLKRAQDTSDQTTSASLSGDFSFENLAPGKYTLAVDLPPVMRPWDATAITVPARGCSEVNVRTAFDGRLAGKVTDKTGAGVAYADVEVVRASQAENAERAFRWVNADKNGVFEIGPLPPDDYVIGMNIVKYSGSGETPRTFFPGVPDVHKARRVHVREGQLVQGLDFQVGPSAAKPSSK